MEIIGEKINGTRKRVAKAIAERNADRIADLACKQAAAGAAWLDVNAGTRPDREPEDLLWLVETIQSAVDTPLCLDSANPDALRAGIQAADRTPMINSINGEPQRLEGILPLVAEHGCPVIALAMDGTRMPETVDRRLAIIGTIVEATRAAGVPDDRVYVDPLAMTLATNTESALIALEAMRAVRQAYPETHLTVGLSNVSFGLPARSLINRAFLPLALEAGLDSALLDPLDRDLMATLLAAKLVPGEDRYCLNYTRAYRAGMLA